MPDGVDNADVVAPEPEVKDGKHPESVSWTQYIGVKEKLGKTEERATKAETGFKEQIASLEEKAKTAVGAEEHKKVTDELGAANAKLKEAEDARKVASDKTVSERREALVKLGIPEAKVRDMPEETLNQLELVLAAVRPKADLGGGGSGSDTPVKAKDRISRGFQALHPTT